MILAIPTATGFFIPCILDESSRWLISKKRINEADAVLQKIANQNGNRFQGTVSRNIRIIYFKGVLDWLMTIERTCIPSSHTRKL